MKKVLIVNAVPVNNGDAALVMAIYSAFEKKGLDVAIATHNYKIVSGYYPDKEIVRDLLDYYIIKKLPIIRYILIPFFLIILKQYREADIVLGAPGGYINSYYGIFDKLYVLFMCKLLGKKTAIYSQSVGPLNARDANRFSFFLNFLDLVYVRDCLSYDTAKALSVGRNNIRLTEDAAFLLEPNLINRNKMKKVAVSVRDWAFDSRDKDKYYFLIAELVKCCVLNGYSVEFLSTCQGVPGYLDDSKVAEGIVDAHLKEVEIVTIDKERRTLSDLRTKLNEYDFVIGTRLHMCILSILNGIPAFNISYEAKGTECYAYLGMSEYSIDYNAEHVMATEQINDFINNLDKLEKHLKERIVMSHSDSVKYFEHFCAELGVI